MIHRLKRILAGTKAATVVVLGMHKSGTSVVAAIVSGLGVHMGDELLGPDSSNPTGHFEDVEILELNERILEASGGSWLNPPPRSAVMKNRRQFKSAIRKIVKARNAKHAIWGWKDPRSVHTLDLFLPQLSNARLIVVRRDGEAVAESLRRRDGTELSAGRKLWRDYNARIDDILLRYAVPRHEIEFESLRNDAAHEIERIALFLGSSASSDDLGKCAQLVLDDEGLQSARERLQEGTRAHD